MAHHCINSLMCLLAGKCLQGNILVSEIENFLLKKNEKITIFPYLSRLIYDKFACSAGASCRLMKCIRGGSRIFQGRGWGGGSWLVPCNL